MWNMSSESFGACEVYAVQTSGEAFNVAPVTKIDY